MVLTQWYNGQQLILLRGLSNLEILVFWVSEIPCMHYYTECMACLMVLLEKEISNQLLCYQSVYGWVVAQALQYGNSFDELEWALLIYIE